MIPSRSADKWIERAWPDRDATLRLFCFHHAGGAASAFCTWPNGLPAHIEPRAVQLPGREKRLAETPFTRFDELIPALADALQPYLRPPFACFGHSLGALVAFELCRLLRRRHAPLPIHLFLSGCDAADQLKPSIPVRDRSDRDLLDLLRSYGGTPDEVLLDEELLELMLPILRADLSLADSYVHVPGEPLDCPISAFGGTDDATTPPSELAAWAAHTRGPFACSMFPGGHFFLQTAQDRVLACIAADLARSQSVPR